ncbi:hypothetical protein [Microbulbifer taiwanensis]|uniref:Uncharacterized protein n=1 Tax=Microbulbifer taiwanensis TaxID=986746 RepID=A0ABW1YRE9_9GAMM|nr:hypothetical protein [Microbulbifer taiwanensis]
MTGRFTSVIRTIGLLCVIGGYAHWLGAQTPETESGHCAAELDAGYFTPLIPTSAQTSELCFAQSGEFDGAEQFLLIDVAAQPRSYPSVSNAIHLSDWQVKTKFFLKNKPLLIVAEPYKRHPLARLCNELIQNGFQHPKILIGSSATNNGERRSAIAPVDDFIVEVSNFGVVTVATNRKVADELAALGIPAVAVESGSNLKAAVRDATINYSLNGYLPVFIVGKLEDELDLEKRLNEAPVNEAFVVSGGIEGIKAALKTSALSAAKRLHPVGVSSCAG